MPGFRRAKARRRPGSSNMTTFEDMVFVFSGATLERALDDWVSEQLAAYPHQAERIRITAEAMRDFFESAHIGRYKMPLGRQAGHEAGGRD
jgi:hypothetical protein